MTTIAADRESMAADSKVVVDGVSFKSTKIFRKGKALIATAGNCGAGNKFIAWYGTKRKKPELKDDEELEALVLTRKGLVYYGNDLEPVTITDDRFAIGSGRDAALTAMRVYGATPEEAVEAACMIDEGTDGPVRVVRLED